MNHRIWVAGIALGLMAAGVCRAQTGGSDSTPMFKSEVSIAVENGVRIIKSNGIPNHKTGHFPGRANPNTIAPQNYEFHMPGEPKVAATLTVNRMQPFGVAVNGVVFDPGADEWWNGNHTSGWQYEPLKMAPLYMGTDASHAHVQPDGAYHYHGIPQGLVFSLTEGKQKMVIVGWAADGFPIYNDVGHTSPKDGSSPLKVLKSSYAIKKGQRPSGPGGNYDGRFVADYEYVFGNGDLDECNGVFGVTPEYPNGIYHYVLTAQFPYIPRMYRGTPDASFQRHGPMMFAIGGGPGGAGPGQGGPPGGRGPDAGGPSPGFHLIPRFAEDQLSLTDEQQKQIADLETETKGKLEKILTAEQMKTLESARPPRGPVGRGGRGGAGPQGGSPDGPVQDRPE